MNLPTDLQHGDNVTALFERYPFRECELLSAVSVQHESLETGICSIVATVRWKWYKVEAIEHDLNGQPRDVTRRSVLVPRKP